MWINNQKRFPFLSYFTHTCTLGKTRTELQAIVDEFNNLLILLLNKYRNIAEIKKVS